MATNRVGEVLSETKAYGPGLATFGAAVAVLVVSGWLAANQGVTLFEQFFSERISADLLRTHDERSALVVAGLCAGAFVIALADLVAVLWKKKPLNFDLPPTIEPFLHVIAASVVGWLIGTTIFT